MSSIFGKLFGGQGGKPQDLVLRAYGKLPFYAEYRRLEVAPGVPTMFSQWLDEGRLARARSVANHPRDAAATGGVRTSRVVFRWPGAREWVIATIWDSRDSLGRRFPFVLFVTCPPDWLGEEPLDRAVACLWLHQRFDVLHGRLATLGSGGDFYRLYQKQLLAPRPDDLATRTQTLRAQARQIQADQWLPAAGLGQVPPAAWSASLMRSVERWRTAATPASGPALACPLAAGIDPAVQTLFWLDWLVQVGVAEKREWSLITSLPDAGGPGRLYVLLRDLLPGDYQLLSTEAGAYGYVEDLAQVPAQDPPEGGTPDLAPPADSLFELLLGRPAAARAD